MFHYAVKLATDNLTTLIENTLRRHGGTTLEKLVRVMRVTVRLLADNRIFLTVILDYLLTQKQHGKDIRRQVRRRTFGLKYLLIRLLREAATAGEIRVRQVETAAHHLYGLLESFILNLTVTNIMDEKDYLDLIDGYIEQLKG